MKNNKDTIIHKYFIDKLKPVEIAKELNISKSAVTQVLQKDKRYVKEKNNRKTKNKETHNEKTKKYMKHKREYSLNSFDFRHREKRGRREIRVSAFSSWIERQDES